MSHLDDRHGDGEDERPERLAHAVRDDLGVCTAASTAPCKYVTP
jgi:hypothetical protein